MAPTSDHSPKRVLAISSQVVRGHVGLSAIVPALQAMGHEVWALPTVLLSNHPAHAHVAGQRVPVAQLDAMLDALEANGWLAGVDAVLTGYLPSPEHVGFAVRAIERIKQHNSLIKTLVDPVLGDEPKGLYIEAAAAAANRDRLVPLADIATPNRFELGWLTGRAVATLPEVRDAAGRLPAPHIVVTSALRMPASMLGHGQKSTEQTTAGAKCDGLLSLLVSARSTFAAAVMDRPRVPNGTGDLLSGLLLGHTLRGCALPEAVARAVIGVDVIVAASAGFDELQLASFLPRAIAAEPCELEQLPIADA